MRKIIVTMWASLDNFVADQDGGMEWLRIDDHMMAYEQSLVEQAGILLLGRKTFGNFADYWPNAAHREVESAERQYAQCVDSIRKVVVSASGKVANWHHSEILPKLDSSTIAALQQGDDGYILVYGSLSVINRLTKLRVVDEFHLLVHSVVLGKGRAMFDEATPVSLELLSAEPFPSGVVLMKYRLSRKP